jgi:enoyl-CoA hydratase
MSDEARVITALDGRLGRITLNRPRAINAVSHDMLAPIAAALAAFGADPTVAAVLIDGAGERGFCAGGDIRAIYESLLAGTSAAVDYWRDEYAVNLAIARFPKPYIAIMDGLTLGGGVGLSSHGSVRIVTERSLVGLTQVNIGFVPDIGGSYLLARSPGRLGYYAALTAAQLGPADAILCGLADVCIASADIAAAVGAVRAAAGARCDIRAAVDTYAIEPPPGTLAEAQPWIDTAFSAPTVAGIIDALRARPEPAAHATAELLGAKSPTALRLTLELLSAGGRRTLEEALAAELEVARALATGHDLREGIRAQVIDKDRNPHWDPAALTR